MNIRNVSVLRRKHLSRIHDALGIHGVLDAPHHIHANVPILGRKQVDLACTNAMFASACATQVKRTDGHAVADSLAGLVLLGHLGVKQKIDMEVSVTHMTKKGS